MSEWEGLTPPYSTIVADPPWHYKQGGPTTGFAPLRGLREWRGVNRPDG